MACPGAFREGGGPNPQNAVAKALLSQPNRACIAALLGGPLGGRRVEWPHQRSLSHCVAVILTPSHAPRAHGSHPISLRLAPHAATGRPPRWEPHVLRHPRPCRAPVARRSRI